MNAIVIPVRYLLSSPMRYRAMRLMASLRKSFLPGHELELRNRMLLAKLNRGKDAQ